MAEAALSFLLEELTDVLKWYGDLLPGLENEFQKLKDDLNSLREAANNLKEDEVYKEMEKQIREVVYVVEDTIGTFLTKTEVLAAQRSLLLSRLWTRRLTDEVKSLREDKVGPVLEKVRSGFAALGSALSASTTADQPPSRPEKHKPIRRRKVVGFEDEEATLMSYLIEETEKLDIISIIGMPGLGKTTLAYKIFDNEEICYQFPIRIWVHVSQSFSGRDMFLEILRRFTGNNMSGRSDEQLAESVRACLAKEKFLLVMDDVWSLEDWKVIQNVLPMSNGFSKVMITSRDKSVGTHANVSRDPHMLRFFRPDESWKLLQLEVFDDAESCLPELETIGKQIAGKCYGVPLTVVVVGGILVDLFMKNQSPLVLSKEWVNVSEHVSRFIQEDMEKRISYVVELSYNRLPDYLRECFLYTAVFPEEHVIPAWMLTRLWIAEGFVLPRGKSLEEAAEENLADLVSRNLLMLDEINPMGEIKTCRVHGMIRGFCRERALEQNIFQEIKKNKEGELEPPVSEVPKFRRLCFQSDLTKFCSEKPDGPGIRSFLCFYKEPVSLDPRYRSTILDAFLKLRVLESISIKFRRFPVKLSKLIHLRYVTLHIEDLTVLPRSLSYLWNLQTLVVETKSRSITMKANIWKMYRLRHLKMKAAIALDEKWDGKGGENLQTLSRLAPESCTAKVCERACNLKELGIRGNLATLFRTMSMENLGRLEKLKLMNDLYDSENQNKIVNLPQHKCFPPKLLRLTLSNTFLDWQHMSTLAKIKTLEVLKLKNNAFAGIYWNATDYDFPTLQLLLINGADLVHWEVLTSSFPQLHSLVLHSCENLNEIPEALAGTLEKLVINRVRKSAVDSARRIEQEKVKRMVGFKLDIGHGVET